MKRSRQCAHCGRTFGPNLVLIGLRAGRCGAHLYAYCRKDNGGCGRTTYNLPLHDDTYRRVSFGYGETS
jgi:hypothetical protein